MDFWLLHPKITLYYWTKEDLGAIPVFHKAIAVFWAHLMSLPVLEIITKISLKTLYKLTPSHIQCYYLSSSTELDNAIQVRNCSMPKFYPASTFLPPALGQQVY